MTFPIDEHSALTSSRPIDSLVSIVLPVFNERAVLNRLVSQVKSGLKATGLRYEIIFVNDGSTDGCLESLDFLASTDSTIRVIHLSRNFGHQAAVHAGLSHAQGDAVVLMDSDLQDDPQAIPAFIEKWKLGYDVVYAVRAERRESALKRGLFFAFYRVLNIFSNTAIPMDAGNFGLISRQVSKEICSFIERDRYYPGLRSWVGFQQTGVVVERKERHDDQPRVSMWGLFRLAKTALFSFSSVPLSLFYLVSAIAIFIGVATAGYTTTLIIEGNPVPDWTGLTILGAALVGVNAFGIALLGEYISRIYDQVRHRPNYIVARTSNMEPLATAAPVPVAKESNVEGLNNVDQSPETLLDWVESNLTSILKTP